MEEIVEEWIDEPTTELVSTRELRRWRNHLQFMDEVMRAMQKEGVQSIYCKKCIDMHLGDTGCIKVHSKIV